MKVFLVFMWLSFLLFILFPATVIFTNVRFTRNRREEEIVWNAGQLYRDKLALYLPFIIPHLSRPSFSFSLSSPEKEILDYAT